MKSTPDILIIGPAFPYRGGIAETNHEFGAALQKQGKKTLVWTFTHLYPNFLFPGKKQFSDQERPGKLNIVRTIHAYNPLSWRKTAKKINQLNPKTVIFRYYTPFLSPCYSAISKRLHPNINSIALVDNWTPHERKPWDAFFNRCFGKNIHQFATLSKGVANEIANTFSKPVWVGFHPIGEKLPPIIAKPEARRRLGWTENLPVVLFFGLIRKYKGLDLLIQAFGKKILKQSDVQLVIVGEFYDSQKKYTQLITRLGLEKRIKIYPVYANSETIQNVFCAADAVVQTYRSATQSGVTPLAYHFHKPLLVSDITGLRDPVINDRTGMTTSLDKSEIARNLIQLLTPKNLLLFQKNIAKALPNYCWDSFSKTFLNFINKV